VVLPVAPGKLPTSSVFQERLVVAVPEKSDVATHATIRPEDIAKDRVALPRHVEPGLSCRANRQPVSRLMVCLEAVVAVAESVTPVTVKKIENKANLSVRNISRFVEIFSANE
jgi:hypothetical protein